MLKLTSPYDVIQRLVNASYTEKESYNIVRFVVDGPTQTTTRVIACMEWSYDWLLDPDSQPLTNALMRLSKTVFNVLALPESYANLRTNLLTFLRNLKKQLLHGLCTHYCKKAPRHMVITDMSLVLSKKELIEYSDMINHFKLDDSD